MPGDNCWCTAPNGQPFRGTAQSGPAFNEEVLHALVCQLESSLLHISRRRNTCCCFSNLLLARGPVPKGAEETVTLDETARLDTCRANSIRLIKPEQIDLFLLNQLSDFCYNQVRGEDLLGDFHVRKSNFVQQEYDSRIILWMVVAITISGVVLAGLQLLAAYRLASNAGPGFASEQGGELKLDAKSISLKSSVTGFLILVISFAFFIVYVRWVSNSDPNGPGGRRLNLATDVVTYWRSRNASSRISVK